MPAEWFAKPENAAALWSAAAASFAALAAYLSWRSQVQTLRHTFRPEIVLSSWQRVPATDTLPERVCFQSVKNTGRDTARQIVINAFATADDNRPTYFMGTVNIASLTAGEESKVDAQIQVHWRSVSKHGSGGKLLPLKVTVWCWDALNVRHTTTLSLMLLEDVSTPVGGAARLAPGVHLSSYMTKSVPVSRLKLRRVLTRIPIVGARYRDDA